MRRGWLRWAAERPPHFLKMDAAGRRTYKTILSPSVGYTLEQF